LRKLAQQFTTVHTSRFVYLQSHVPVIFYRPSILFAQTFVIFSPPTNIAAATAVVDA